MRKRKLETVILEDDMVSRLILEHYCDNHPSISFAAAFDDIDEAIEYLGKKEVDVIFLDIHLKTTSGFDMLKHIPPSVSVVVTSGDARNMEIARMFEIPHYLQKPITLELFLKVVEEIKQRKSSL